MADEIKPKKSIWKRWWFWLIIVFVIIAIASAGGSKNEEPIPELEQTEGAKEPETKPEIEPEPEPKPEPEPETEIETETTLGEKNALRKAIDYLDYTAFSYSGLIEQLKYEGFTHQQATYGAEAVGY